MDWRVAHIENLLQTAAHRRSIREEIFAFFLFDLVIHSTVGTKPVQIQ